MRRRLLLFGVVATQLISVAPAHADEACGQTVNGLTQSGCIDSPGVLGLPVLTNGLSGGAGSVVNILGILAGILSVVFLVIGGLKYTTSAGNSQRVESAKQTLLYAVIGLIISILAPAIAGFVITKS